MFKHKKRREKLLKKIKNNTIIIIFGNREYYRNNDVTYPFRQNSNFLYLIGLNEPNAISILEKKDNKINYILFSKKKDKLSDIWDGNILGQDKIIDIYKPDYAFCINEFEKRILKFLENNTNICYISENKKYYKNYIISLCRKIGKDHQVVNNVSNIVNAQRMIKDCEEIERYPDDNYYENTYNFV